MPTLSSRVEPVMRHRSNPRTPTTGHNAGMSRAPELTVRLATRNDVDSICAICEAGFRFVSSPLLPPEVVDQMAATFYVPDRVAREVDPGTVTRHWQGYVVAEEAGVVVGAAGGGMVGDAVGQLYVIYLDLERRGRGIGSALLDFVTAQHKELEAVTQRVAVLADNVHGVPFYKARGFAEVECRIYPAHDPNGAPELVLERSI